MTALGDVPPPGEKHVRVRLLPVLALSLLAHGIVLLLMIADGRKREAAPLREIPVELVREVPPPKPPEPKPAAQPKPPDPPKPPAQSKLAASPKPPSPPAPKQQPKRPEPVQPRRPAPPKTAERPHAAPQPPATKPRESVEQRMDRLLGPMPAVPLPSVAADGDESASYKQIVLSQVAKAKKVGRYQGVPGAAAVSFTVGADGALVRCEIVRKSVDPKLDAEALAMVRRAAPFPPPPAGAERDYVIGLRFQAM